MRLTAREQTVFGLIAQGLSDRQVAAELAVSLSTARKHRENLLSKFQVRKSTQLVARYFLLGSGSQEINASTTSEPPVSAREMEIIRLLLQGLGDKEVGRSLGISDQTARTHRANLLRKAGAANVRALLYQAITNGWLAQPAAASSAPKTKEPCIAGLLTPPAETIRQYGRSPG